jgi:hypothetical protein
MNPTGLIDERTKATDDFNARQDIQLQEKITMYLCGLGCLAREFMIETNATSFKTETMLEPRDGSKKLHVVVTVKEIL